MKRTEAWLDEPPFTLHVDDWGVLVLNHNGQEHVGVEVVRAFPLSDPEHGVAVCDSRGRELVWIDDLQALPASVRQVLEDHLSGRDFVPVVRRILSISAPVEPSEWQVETDRGSTRFLLNSEDDLHRLDEHRALVTDSHGVRYLIPDTRVLDATSRRLLERYL